MRLKILGQLSDKIVELTGSDEESDRFRPFATYLLVAAVVLWFIAMAAVFFSNLPDPAFLVATGGGVSTAAKMPGIARFLFNACTIVTIAHFAYGLLLYMKPADVMISTGIMIVLEIISFMLLCAFGAGMLVMGIVAAASLVMFGLLGTILIGILIPLLGMSFVILPGLAVLVIGASFGVSAVIVIPVAAVFLGLCWVFKVNERHSIFSRLVAFIVAIGFAWPALTFCLNFQFILPNRYGEEARQYVTQYFKNDEEKVLSARIKHDGFYREFINTEENSNFSMSTEGVGGAAAILKNGWKLSFYDGDSEYFSRDLSYGAGENFLASSDGDDMFTADQIGNVYYNPIYSKLKEPIVVLLYDKTTTIYSKDRIYMIDDDRNFHVDKKTTWYKEYEAMTESARMTAIYDILLKQSVENGENFTSTEVGWVAYAQRSGFLLTYLDENQTAYFAKPEGDRMTVYYVDSSRKPEELIETGRIYNGFGTGYFTIGNYFYFADDRWIRCLDLTNKEDFTTYIRVIDYDGDYITGFGYTMIEAEPCMIYAVNSKDSTGIVYFSYKDKSAGVRMQEGKELISVLGTKDVLHMCYRVEPQTAKDKIKQFFSGFVKTPYKTDIGTYTVSESIWE